MSWFFYCISVLNEYDDYNWSTGSNNEQIEVSSIGTYSVTVTDDFGCTGEAEISVDTLIPPSPVILGDDSFCEGTTLELDAGAGYSGYSWSTGDDSQFAEVSSSGFYTVRVTDDNGCVGTASILIAADPLPFPIITGTDFCIGDQTTLDAGPGFDSYLWSNGDNGQTTTITEAGTYSVTVSNEFGCLNSASETFTTFPLPNVIISGSSSFCEGNSTILDAGIGFSSYNWSDGSTSQSILVNTAGEYSVTVTNQNGCLNSDMIIVTEEESLSPIIAGSDFCSGLGTILDSGSGFETYLWSDGSNDQTLYILNPGTYSVTVTDISGCSGVGVISVSNLPDPTPVISGDIAYCEGESAYLDAGGGYINYQWSNGSSDQSIEINSPGSYSVIVTDINGCVGVNISIR